MIPFLDLKAQQKRLEPELTARIAAVLAHCQFVMGPEVAELEQRLAAHCGAETLRRRELRHRCAADRHDGGRRSVPGDAVFLPAFTYTATAEVPLVLGATPVFVDRGSA